MLACLDAAYRADRGVGACVLFDDWTDSLPALELVRECPAPEPYRSGELYRRELPCLLAVLGAVAECPSVLVIDGYVWLSDAGAPGLGGHLYAALDRRVTVIGVAKRPYPGASAVPVLRGRSRQPLFVSAAGAELSWTASRIRAMHGPYRIPTLLKRADRLARASATTGDSGGRR